MNSDNFNFYHELTKQQNYDLLIPDKNIILVVVQLYQKEQAGEFHREDGMFREEVILECIRIANPTEQRIQHELHNQIVQKLLHYFLWRDEDGRYTLKDYAKELCKLIEGRLHGQFNPTHIEKVFNELIQSLNMVWPDISKSPERFNDWVDMHLKERLPAIREQVEILDKKVDEAVTKIQIKAASPDEDFLDLLQSVDAELDTVTAQVNELDSVFHSSEEIRRKLRELQNHPNQEIFDDKVSEVYSFLSKNGERLRWVRRRIDKVRPRIQRLFSDLRKRDFDLKTERFLSHLLKHSDFVRHEQPKMIRLPNNINLKQVYSETLVFTEIRKKSFLPPTPIKIRRPIINKDYQQKQYQHIEDTRQKQKRLDYWFYKVQSTLENNLTITYSPLFYQILTEEANGFPIALELAYRILDEYAKKDNYQLIIGKQVIREDNFRQYSLYEIEVRKFHV